MDKNFGCPSLVYVTDFELCNGSLSTRREDACFRIVSQTPINGFLNVDLRVTDHVSSTVVLECNPRGELTLRIWRRYGANFGDLGIQFALGKEMPFGDFLMSCMIWSGIFVAWARRPPKSFATPRFRTLLVGFRAW